MKKIIEINHRETEKDTKYVTGMEVDSQSVVPIDAKEE